MSLETGITQAWQRQAWWLWLLWPLSGLFSLISRLRQLSYQRGWRQQYRAPVPVLVIGNITVGGSGKTPLIMALVAHLHSRGLKVGVISRGYGGDEAAMPLLVTPQSLPSQVGDEPCLIVAQTGVAMAVCPNRQQAIETLLTAHPDIQLIIADDGLQHYALARDIEWIVVDASRGFGNQQLLPTGFLREPISRLKDATVIWHQTPDTVANKDKPVANQHQNLPAYAQVDSHLASALTIQLQPSALTPLLPAGDYPHLLKRQEREGVSDNQNIQNMTSAKPHKTTVHAISGIGYPQRFFTTLRNLGLTVIEHPYPDHHAFSWTDLSRYSEYPIVMTSKDAIKFRVLAEQQLQQTLADPLQQQALSALLARLWVLPVEAQLSAACYETLQRQLKTVGLPL
jgi:tetraacyldisaccharide 4'-kinase